MEAFILVMVSTIGVCFLVEIILSRPTSRGSRAGSCPPCRTATASITRSHPSGATVMPHNLYLHLALVSRGRS